MMAHDQRQAERRRVALAGWVALGRQAVRRKADRDRLTSLRQGAWMARYDAARLSGPATPGAV